MSTLFIDRRNIDVRVDAGALVFYEDKERVGTVPVGPVDRVFMKGNASVSVNVFSELGKRGIGVTMLAGFKDEPVLFLPAPHQDASRRLSQAVLSQDPEFCRLFAADIVREKLTGQKHLLDEIYAARPELGIGFNRCRTVLAADIDRINEQTTMNEIRGIEGHGAKTYFEALTHVVPKSLAFTGRNKRPPRDPLNAVLSLTYTLLVAEVALQAHSVGLDPYFGFLHTMEYGRLSLACDLCEPFRPIADKFCLTLFKEKTLRPEDFTTSEKGCFMGKAARARYYPAYESAACLWRKLIERKVRRLVGDFIDKATAQRLTLHPAGEDYESY